LTAGSAAPGSSAGALEIRPVTIDDLETLIEIYLDTARHHAAIDPEVFHVPPRDAIAARLRHKVEGRGTTGEYVVAIVGGRMAGSASVDLGDLPSTGSMLRPVTTAEFGVSVVDGFRGLGIGRQLIAACERWAAEHGVERMILTVAEENDGAIRLYRELGYRHYDHLMLKPLGPA
jgi:GNAT superfamily N-acetyltransferase